MDNKDKQKFENMVDKVLAYKPKAEKATLTSKAKKPVAKPAKKKTTSAT
ncbi:MAG TPA: hypothetical protein VLB90_00850 [Pseudomonadales bacterium]|nr:hypothetical protein [Pseudomonadales bacterium]